MKNQLLYFLFQAGKPEQNIGANLFSQTSVYCFWRNCCCCLVMNEFQAFTALVLNSVMDSVDLLNVLTFSATAFITLTVSWLLIRTAPNEKYRYICQSSSSKTL